jgi:hypothetical protein
MFGSEQRRIREANGSADRYIENLTYATPKLPTGAIGESTECE